MFVTLEYGLPTPDSLTMNVELEMNYNTESSLDIFDQDGIDTKKLSSVLRVHGWSNQFEEALVNHISQCEDFRPSITRVIDAVISLDESITVADFLKRLLNELGNRFVDMEVKVVAFRYCMEKEYYGLSKIFDECIFQILKVLQVDVGNAKWRSTSVLRCSTKCVSMLS
jgi:hypothetical protein